MTDDSVSADDGRHALDDIDLGAAIAAELPLWAHGNSVIVGVTHGVVTLEGDVDKPEHRDAIEARVRRFAGVREIMNLITVRAAAPVRQEFPEDHQASESPR